MDWLAWHRAYDDPESALSTRLDVVRRRIGEALDVLGSRCRQVLSLCAGTGGDLLPELAARNASRPEVLLVELDPSLAQAASVAADDLGLEGVEVATADAGDPATFANRLPADLLLLCGIFGNVSEADIRTTLSAVPALVAPGGFVVWTRGRFDDVDLRPQVRQWSLDAGLTEVAFDGDPAQHGVGLYRFDRAVPAPELPDRLFTFIR